jgi:hypothetical protein
MTRKTGWPVRVKLPTLPAEWQAGDAMREARPVRTIDLSDRTDWVSAPLAGRQLPPALVSGEVSRCPASDAEHLASAQHVQDPGYRRLRIQQRHASVPGPDFHGRHHQRRHRSRIGVAQVRRVDGQLHRLPGYPGGEHLVQPRDASPAKTRTGPDAPAATDTSSKLTAFFHGHGQA